MILFSSDEFLSFVDEICGMVCLGDNGGYQNEV